MKKILMFLLFLFLSVGFFKESFAYTDVTHKTRLRLDGGKSVETVDYYPKAFGDGWSTSSQGGTVGIWNEAFYAFENSNVFSKIDVSGDGSFFPSLNQQLKFILDKKFLETKNFRFALYDFLSNGGYSFPSSWSLSNENITGRSDQGAAIQFYGVDADGNEIGQLDVYMSGTTGVQNEYVGSRKVITSFHNGIQSLGHEHWSKAYYIKGSDINSLVGNFVVTDKNFSDRKLVSIRARIFNIVKVGGTYYEYSYLPDSTLGKIGFDGKDENGNFVTVPSSGVSNYFAIASPDVVQDGIVVPGMDFNALLTALDSEQFKDTDPSRNDAPKSSGDGTFNNDGTPGTSTFLSRAQSEYLSYYGAFSTIQAKNNVTTGPSTLFLNKGSLDRQYTSRYQPLKLLAGQSSLVFLAIDADNKYDAPSMPQGELTFSFYDVPAGTFYETDKAQTGAQTTEQIVARITRGLENSAISVLSQPVDQINENSGKNAFKKGAAGMIAPFLVENFGDKSTAGISRVFDIYSSYGAGLQSIEIPYSPVEGLEMIGSATSFSEAIKINGKFPLQTGGQTFFNYKADDLNTPQLHAGDEFGFGSANATNGRMKKKGIGILRVPVEKLILGKNERKKYLQAPDGSECPTPTGDELYNCSLKEDYTFYWSYNFSQPNNAVAIATNGDNFTNEHNKIDATPVDIGLENKFCVFYKPFSTPGNTYSLINRNTDCSDLFLKDSFTTGQDNKIDALNFNRASSAPSDAIKNPTSQLPNGKAGLLTLDKNNICDYTFVGKAWVSNVDPAGRAYSDISLQLGSLSSKNIEILSFVPAGANKADFTKVTDVNTYKYDPYNSTTRTLGLIPDKNLENGFIESQGAGKPWRVKELPACETAIGSDGVVNDEGIYVTNTVKSSSAKECKIAYEFAFRVNCSMPNKDETLLTSKKQQLENVYTDANNPANNKSIWNYGIENLTSFKQLPFQLTGSGVSSFDLSVTGLKFETKKGQGDFSDSANIVGKKTITNGAGLQVSLLPELQVYIKSSTLEGKPMPTDSSNLNTINGPLDGKGGVSTEVCLKNNSDVILYDAHIYQVNGKWFDGISPNNTDRDLIKIPSTSINLNPGEEYCKDKLLTVDMKNNGAIPTVEYLGKAYYDDPGSTKVPSKPNFSETFGQTEKLGWKIEYVSPISSTKKCVASGGGQVCLEFAVPSACFDRGGYHEYAGKFTNSSSFPVYDLELKFIPDTNLTVTQTNLSALSDGSYYKLTSVLDTKSTDTNYSVVVTNKNGIPTGTKFQSKFLLSFFEKDSNGNKIKRTELFDTPVIANSELCNTDSKPPKDFITLELPTKNIGENTNSTNLKKDGGPLKNSPNDGTIGNTNISDPNGGNPGVSQKPGKNNRGVTIPTPPNSSLDSQACSLYNPTDPSSNEQYLPDELPTSRTVKANYFRVESDPDAVSSIGRRISWNNAFPTLWGTRGQFDAYDYTDGYRDMFEGDSKVIYKNVYIDWTIELPCELKLSSNFFGTNDEGDSRGQISILSQQSINIAGNNCGKKIVLRQYIKTKGDTYPTGTLDVNTYDSYLDDVQKRMENVSYPKNREEANTEVWKYITFQVTPDGKQKVDGIRERNNIDKYIKVEGKLNATKELRRMSDYGSSMSGKGNSGNQRNICWGTTTVSNGYRHLTQPFYSTVTYPCNCGKKGCSTCSRTECRVDTLVPPYQLNYHRDTNVGTVPYTNQAVGSTYQGTYGLSGENLDNLGGITSGNKTAADGNKALLLIDICNPGAALCAIGGDIYAQGNIDLSKVIYDNRKPTEYSVIAGGGITQFATATDSNNSLIRNVSLAFEDPNGTNVDKYQNPQKYCDYIDPNTGKPLPTTGLTCKTTLFEDLITGKKGQVKMLNRDSENFNTDFNLSDPTNPLNNSNVTDYTKGKDDIVWYRKGDLVIGDNPLKTLNVRGKGTVFVDGDLYINSNMQYITNGVSGTAGNSIEDSKTNIDSALFVVSGDIIVGPDVTSTVGIFSAMGLNSTFYSCGRISDSSLCSSRSPLLIQKLISRNIRFDRKASNVPLYVKKAALLADGTEDMNCKFATDALTKPECYTKVDQLTSSECIVDDQRDILNPPSGLLDIRQGGIKRIEIAPGDHASNRGYYEKFQ